MAKKDEVESFDLEQEIVDYPVPEMFKAGLRYYISSRKLKIKDKKELDKIVKEFSEISL